MRYAYLGPEATFTHQAAIRRFGSSLIYSPQKTIADVFSEVSRNHAEYGVVPVENSTEGVVTHTLDMFTDSDLKIVAQVLLPIEHYLIGKGRLKSINKLYSHPQAFAQCRGWLRLEITDDSGAPLEGYAAAIGTGDHLDAAPEFGVHLCQGFREKSRRDGVPGRGLHEHGRAHAKGKHHGEQAGHGDRACQHDACHREG